VKFRRGKSAPAPKSQGNRSIDPSGGARMNWKHLLSIIGLLILGAVIQSKTKIFSKIPVVGTLLV
jgi:hypothetical protein